MFYEYQDDFNPKKLIQDIVKLESINLEHKQIEIVLDLEGVSRIELMKGDKMRIMQILLNLVQNAIKFSKFCGTIEIKCSYHERTSLIELTVTDNGMGIAKKDIPRLFTMYGRIQKTNSQNPNGTGLGLYICKLLC